MINYFSSKESNCTSLQSNMLIFFLVVQSYDAESTTDCREGKKELYSSIRHPGTELSLSSGDGVIFILLWQMGCWQRSVDESRTQQSSELCYGIQAWGVQWLSTFGEWCRFLLRSKVSCNPENLVGVCLAIKHSFQASQVFYAGIIEVQFIQENNICASLGSVILCLTNLVRCQASTKRQWSCCKGTHGSRLTA